MSYASSVQVAILENFIADLNVKRTQPESVRGYEPVFDKTIVSYSGSGKKTHCVPSLAEAAHWRGHPCVQILWDMKAVL